MSENVCRCGRCDIHLNIMFIKLYLGAQVIEKQRDSQGDTGEDWDMVSSSSSSILGRSRSLGKKTNFNF